MVHAAAVSIDEMRPKLLTLDQARERLAATEPLTEATSPTGSGWNWEIPEDWAKVPEKDPVPGAFVTTPGGQRFQLTSQAVQEAAAYVKPGIPREVSKGLPVPILRDILGWAYSTGIGNREFKILSQADRKDAEGHDIEPLALAMCRGTLRPFSNLGLLEQVLGGIHNAYGSDAEVLVDYKFHHDLERTNVRLVVPGQSRVITGTRVANDTWCAGISLTNSLIGVSNPGTGLDGYLFRWWCTNGCTDTLARVSKLARRTVRDPADAMAWARSAVDEVLGGLEHSFEAVQELTGQVVPSGEVAMVMGDLFTRGAIPQAEQNRIMDSLAELEGQTTMYDLQNAITLAANAEGLSPRTVDNLHALGGFTVRAGHARCSAAQPCRRPLPAGYTPTVVSGELLT